MIIGGVLFTDEGVYRIVATSKIEHREKKLYEAKDMAGNVIGVAFSGEVIEATVTLAEIEDKLAQAVLRSQYQQPTTGEPDHAQEKRTEESHPTNPAL